MDRTTIMLPTELKQKAMRCSRRLGVSFGEFVRLSIQDALACKYPETTDSLFEDHAVFEGSSPTDAAENHDELLYGEKS